MFEYYPNIDKIRLGLEFISALVALYYLPKLKQNYWKWFSLYLILVFLQEVFWKGIFALLAISLIFISISTTGLISMWSILAVGLFNSIMFPTIFTLALDGIGSLKPKGSGLLCTAIVGGAIIPLICGALIDASGFKIAFIFVTICYGYIMFYGIRNNKKIVTL